MTDPDIGPRVNRSPGDRTAVTFTGMKRAAMTTTPESVPAR